MDETIRTAAISPLRQRMIDDMNVRRFSYETQRNYVRDVGRFATFLRRSPDTATADDVRRFEIEQNEAGVPTPTMNSIASTAALPPSAVMLRPARTAATSTSPTTAVLWADFVMGSWRVSSGIFRRNAAFLST
jgi:hypothetical protein